MEQQTSTHQDAEHQYDLYHTGNAEEEYYGLGSNSFCLTLF